MYLFVIIWQGVPRIGQLFGEFLLGWFGLPCWCHLVEDFGPLFLTELEEWIGRTFGRIRVFLSFFTSALHTLPFGSRSFFRAVWRCLKREKLSKTKFSLPKETIMEWLDLIHLPQGHEVKHTELQGKPPEWFYWYTALKSLITIILLIHKRWICQY